MMGGSLYFGGDTVYTFEISVVDIKSLFIEILSGDYQVIGYDLKKDLERIEAYLEETSSEVEGGQMGLF